MSRRLGRVHLAAPGGSECRSFAPAERVKADVSVVDCSKCRRSGPYRAQLLMLHADARPAIAVVLDAWMVDRRDRSAAQLAKRLAVEHDRAAMIWIWNHIDEAVLALRRASDFVARVGQSFADLVMRTSDLGTMGPLLAGLPREAGA